MSTEIALSNVHESLIKNFESSLVTCSVFLDISKAFDSVDHELLLRKLEMYGVRGLPLELLRSYLTDRYQYTKIDGNMSTFLPVTCGVPQGSVLGPFLFSVFVNDLPAVTEMETTLFADDACFSFGHLNLEVLELYVNNELKKISKWYSNNKLALNVDKSNCILIHRKKQKIKINLVLNDVLLEQLEEVKYLGITIDEHLNWKSHIYNCTLQLNKCLWAITKLRPYTTISTLKLVYYALAYPYIQYCITTWGGASDLSLKPLLIKQKRIIKTMLYEPTISRSSPLFHKLNLLKLNEIYDLKVGTQMFKVNQKNSNFLHEIPLISSVHDHNTRLNSNANYYKHSVTSELGKTAFSYYGPKVWNTIPMDVRNSTAFQFKSLYKDHLLQKYLSLP